ncbi:GNAT family N-acetyltransferase [Thiobacillus sp.]|uniref:GNAT family N-acetyltransferase n=1 Tax=Thiobacillus sp. TaxID=924 RepID=UPI001AC42C4B|nr:GNAT family N-acetyltransferase [Thiobacillus sp.]MBN8779887.1 GNAT family N-acetyltransferase [Thiobacillus sp.]
MQTDCRLATESDADDIAALVNRAYRPGASARGWTHEAHLVAGDRTTPAQILALLHARAAILVLCRDDTLVACVHAQGDASIVWLGMLATEPALQSQGLGKRMLQHAEDFAVDRFKATEVRMAVLAARPELIAFYERRGYARTGQVADYPVAAGTGQPRVEGLKVAILGKQTPTGIYNHADEIRL